jgi:CheY-like chemotaxis protein
MENLITFLIEIEYDTIIKIKCHKYASEYYHYWNNILSLPVILLSTFTGSTIFASDNNKEMMHYMTSGFGIIIAVLSSIDKFFDFSKLCEYHSNLAKLYESLQRDLNFFIKENTIETVNDECINNIKNFIKEIHQKIEHIENENNISIPIHIYEKIKKYENRKSFIKEKIKLYNQTINFSRNISSDIEISQDDILQETVPELIRQSSFKDLISKKMMSNINFNKSINPSNKEIIVLDDNEIHLLLIRKILMNEYNVNCFNNINEFYNNLNKNIYNLVILDYLLLNDNGGNIAENIKKNNKDIIILCVTSYDEIYEDDKKKYIDYIYKKPLVKNSFLKFIKNILKLHNYSSTITFPTELDSV